MEEVACVAVHLLALSDFIYKSRFMISHAFCKLKSLKISAVFGEKLSGG